MITLPECTAPGVWLPLHTFSVQLVFLQESGVSAFQKQLDFVPENEKVEENPTH